MIFSRIRKAAGISRKDGVTRQPGYRDLRHTFAVNRIVQWHKDKQNLDLMLSWLAAYMGMRNLALTDRYLSLSPAHFKQQVRRLARKPV
jgi:integrase/recombinase XerD